MSKQSSIVLSDECRQQIRELAEYFGENERRHLKVVVERCVAMVHQYYLSQERLERAWREEQWYGRGDYKKAQ